VLGERVTGLRRDDPAAYAREQIHAERLLQLAHLLGDRRLGDAQDVGGRRERAVLRCRREAPDLLQRHKLCL
jgi:hypothetical protein